LLRNRTGAPRESFFSPIPLCGFFDLFEVVSRVLEEALSSAISTAFRRCGEIFLYDIHVRIGLGVVFFSIARCSIIAVIVGFFILSASTSGMVTTT
jgi:hypothetical protein